MLIASHSGGLIEVDALTTVSAQRLVSGLLIRVSQAVRCMVSR